MLKNGIDSDTYYKLLEWKDNNHIDWSKVHGGRSLSSLTVKELQMMYTMIDENNLW